VFLLLLALPLKGVSQLTIIFATLAVFIELLLDKWPWKKHVNPT
jgi:hypothetical protein